MIKLVLFGFSIFYLLSNQRVKSQETNDVDNFNYTEIEGTKTDINFELSQKTHQNISVYQFNSNYPRQLVVQLSYLNLKPMPKQKIYELQIYIYEYSALIDCQNAFISQKYSPENLITILSLSHMIDHIKFNEQYFYLVYARINYFKQSNSDDSSELDAVNANLMFKFTENIFCQQKGKYDQTLGKCICEKNRFGPFCEYDIQIVTNYYPFEVSIKPFEGRYIQIYKISAEDELKLEMNIKHSQVPDIHMYRSDRSNEFPTQFKYFENLVFNSTNYSNVIQPNPNENSIILFIRNPSTSYIYVTLNIKNITLIDENNLILFILLSLLVTLVISFLCIFCFNKATSGKKEKHVELQETNEEQKKENQPQGQNGSTPQTNRNLIEEIKTQRENQIKSEMEQITQGNKYEQFQLENSFKEQICAICLDDFEYDDIVRKTKCNHMFHEKCLYKWLFKYISCPMCNQDLT